MSGKFRLAGRWWTALTSRVRVSEATDGLSRCSGIRNVRRPVFAVSSLDGRGRETRPAIGVTGIIRYKVS